MQIKREGACDLPVVNPGAGIAPGVVAVLTVLSFYRVGDALRGLLDVET